MNDKIRKAMMRPDCIMGVVPDNGGSWLSPIREDWAQPTTLPATTGQPWAIGSGMLTPTNTTVEDNYFVFPNNKSLVKSSFDFKGYDGDFSIFVDFEVYNLPTEQTARWWLKLFEQGDCQSGYPERYAIGAYFRKDNANAAWSLYCMHTNGTAQSIFAAAFEPVGRHSFVYVKNQEAGYFTGYKDGIQIVTKQNDALKLPLNGAISVSKDYGFSLAGEQNYMPTGIDFRIHSLAVFNRALSAEEIADLS